MDLQRLIAIAKERLPIESHSRLDAAAALVAQGDVDPQDNGTYHVASQSTPHLVYVVARHACSCQDYQYGTEWCKHRLAACLHRRLLQGEPAFCPGCGLQDCTEPSCGQQTRQEVLDAQLAQEPAQDVPALDPQFLTIIHGKTFVTYAGLLALAHRRGMVSLAARFVRVSDDLALAEATATFSDGRTFTEAADATPGNVTARVRAHFPRMALTRAKARCLRDALNIATCSVEEIAE